MAEFTRAVAYDRPGTGGALRTRARRWSPPGALATELREFLTAAGLPDPVVLVSHAFGGFIARAFAAAHPGSVAGMVLGDANHEDEWSDRYPDAHRRGRAEGDLTAANTVSHSGG